MEGDGVIINVLRYGRMVPVPVPMHALRDWYRSMNLIMLSGSWLDRV